MSTIVETLPFPVLILVHVLLFVCLIASWGCVVTYVLVSPRWHHNEIGRHMVWFMVCLAMFMTYYVVRLLWPGMPGQGLTLIILFVSLTVVLVWRLVLFLRLLIEKRRLRRAGDQHAHSE